MNSNVVVFPFPPNAIALLKDIIKSRDRALPSTIQKLDRAYFSSISDQDYLKGVETTLTEWNSE